MRILRSLYRIVSHNLAWKIAALLASTTLWMSVNGSEPNADRYLRFPVSPFGLPKNLIIANDIASSVEVHIRGPRSILRTIDQDTHRVALDLHGVSAGRFSVKVARDMLNLPRRTSVLGIAPARIDLRVEQRIQKSLPVRAVLVPQRRNGYTISKAEVTPATVDVSGPAGRLKRLQVIETEPINTLGADGKVERDVRLAAAGKWLEYNPETVSVSFTISEIEGRRTFLTVPVEVRDATVASILKPATITVTVRGPQVRLGELKLGYGSAYVDASGLEPGVYSVAPTVTVPEGLIVDEIQPPLLQLRLAALAGAS